MGEAAAEKEIPYLRRLLAAHAAPALPMQEGAP